MKKFISTTLLILSVMVPLSAFAQDPQSGTSGGPAPFNYSTGGAPTGLLNQSNFINSGGSASTARTSGCSSLATDGLGGVVGCILTIFNYLVVLMVAGAVVFVIYGAFIMITSEEKRAAGRQTIIYGVVGLFVMISVWGLVSILDRTFNLRSQPIDPPRLTR